MTTFVAMATLLVVGSLWWLIRAPWGPTPAIGRVRRGPTNLGLAVVVPMLVIAMYAALGHPDAIAPAPADPDRALAEERTATLAARLDAFPGDAAGWRLLARSQEQLHHMPEAIRAYRQLVSMRPDDTDALVDLAVALATTQGGDYSGEPIALATKALAFDAADTRALALVANEAAQRDDLPAAIAAWERLIPLVPAGGDVVRSLRMNLDGARKALAERPTGVR